MRNLCALIILLFLSSFCCESRAENPKLTPTPKPYVWADWLTETENVYLRKFWKTGQLSVTGEDVFMDIGSPSDNMEQQIVPDVLVRLFKRYQQASRIIIHWDNVSFSHYNEYDDMYLLKEQRLINLDVSFSNYTFLLNGPLKLEQMREVAAGRLTLEQAWNNSKEVKPPVKK